MKSLLLNLADLHTDLKTRSLAIFLDYDGTLTAIAPSPAEARLRPHTAVLLKNLLLLKDVRVVIISGRARAELESMVNVPGAMCVGSHGAESSDGQGFTVPEEYKQALARVTRILKEQCAGFKGILFDEKPFSLAVHYRLADAGTEKRVKAAVLAACSDLVRERTLSLLGGKKVVEIMPFDRPDKGRAVAQLMRLWREKGPFPIFIGDDETDESVFKELRGRGLTVRVCKDPMTPSAAEYYLHDPKQVEAFLEVLIYIRTPKA